VSGELRRAGRAAKVAERATRAAKYRTGEVVQITDASHARVDIGTKVVPVTVPGSLSSSLLVGQQVQIRILRNDYTLSAILSHPDGAITDGAGTVTARTASSGAATFTATSVGSLAVGGEDIMSRIDSGPRGVVASAVGTVDSADVTTTETKYLELRAALRPERSYVLQVLPHMMDTSDSGSSIQLRLRAAYDGGAVSSSSTQIARGQYYAAAATPATFGGIAATISTNGQADDYREVRIMYSLVRGAGSGSGMIQGSAAPVTMQLVDCGPYIPASGVVIRYTSTWQASEVWEVTRTGPASSRVRLVEDPDTCTVGSSVFGIAIFADTADSGEPKTIADALTGASLIKAEAYLYVVEDSSDAGDNFTTPIRTHPYASPTSAHFPVGTAISPVWASTPAGKWVDISSIFSLADRGLWVGQRDDTPELESGAISAHPAKVKLRLTYER
jgi:hypothetical protein